MHKNLLLTGVVLLGIGAALNAIGATNTPLTVQRVGAEFSAPVLMASPPEDTNRLFVVEQHTGRIRILDLNTGVTNAVPFLEVTDLTAGNEQGLLGFAFHPDYASNGLFYVNYTTRGGGNAGHTEIVSFN